MKRKSFRRFVDAVEIERLAQDAKFGEQHMFDGTDLAGDDTKANAARFRCQQRASIGLCTWRDVLDEEIREAFAERDPGNLRTELIQCAAVIAAWLQDMDGR